MILPAPDAVHPLAVMCVSRDSYCHRFSLLQFFILQITLLYNSTTIHLKQVGTDQQKSGAAYPSNQHFVQLHYNCSFQATNYSLVLQENVSKEKRTSQSKKQTSHTVTNFSIASVDINVTRKIICHLNLHSFVCEMQDLANVYTHTHNTK